MQTHLVWLDSLGEELRTLRDAVSEVQPRVVLLFDERGRQALPSIAQTLDIHAEQALDLFEVVGELVGDAQRVVAHLGHESGASLEATVMYKALLVQLDSIGFAAAYDVKTAKRHMRRMLSQCEELDLLLGACDSMRRKLRRAVGSLLQGLDQLFGRCHDAEADDRVAQLESSIAVRNMYSRFQATLRVQQPREYDELQSILHHSGIALSVMIAEADFSDVRLEDRRSFMELQARVLEWHRDKGDFKAGWRIFSDLCSAAELLYSINQRQELQEHDRDVVQKLSIVLEDAADEVVMGAAMPWLASLRGRSGAFDHALDTMTADGWNPASIDRLRQEVGELRQQVVPN